MPGWSYELLQIQFGNLKGLNNKKTYVIWTNQPWSLAVGNAQT